jgi:regulator of replication initiation timing
MDVFKQMLTEIQNMNKLMQSLSEENSQLRAQLGTCREVKPMAATMHEASKVQAPLTTTSTYKNNEKRVYERGKDGFIKSITIVRDAKVNAV